MWTLEQQKREEEEEKEKAAAKRKRKYQPTTHTHTLSCTDEVSRQLVQVTPSTLYFWSYPWSPEELLAKSECASI